MRNSSLKSIIEQIEQPSFDDEMIAELMHIAKLVDSEEKFYSEIQYVNSLNENQSTEINFHDNEDFKSKYKINYVQKDTFNHVWKNRVGEIHNRLYINCAKQDIMKLVTIFADRCDKGALPFYFKYCFNSKKRRTDQVVIYSNMTNTEKYVKILREIANEHPDIVTRCGRPPILTGKLDGWIGFGDEPSRAQVGRIGEKNASYTGIRSKIIMNVLSKNKDEKDFDKIRRLIMNELEKFGITQEKFCINDENMPYYQNKNGEMELVQKSYDDAVQRHDENIKNRRELNILSLLNTLSANEFISKDMQKTIKNMLKVRKNYLLDIYEQNSSLQSNDLMIDGITEDMEFSTNGEEIECAEGIAFINHGVDTIPADKKKSILQTLYKGFTEYYKDFLMQEIENIEQTKIRYQELEEIENLPDGSLYMEKANLYSKLNMIANAKEFLMQIGMPIEEFGEICEQTKIFIEKGSELSPEEKNASEQRKSAIDRDYLYVALKQTGVTDIDELRKIYESQDNVRVSPEDLKAILAELAENYEPGSLDNESNNRKSGTKVNTEMGITWINEQAMGYMVGRAEGTMYGATSGSSIVGKKFPAKSIGKATINASTLTKKEVDKVEKENLNTKDKVKEGESINDN